MLERHVRLRLKTNTSAENISQRGALLGQGIDHGCAGRGQRGLEHVAQHAQHAVEGLVFAFGRFAVQLPLDAGHQLGDDDEVDDQRRGEEGVLADVGHAKSLLVYGCVVYGWD